MRQSKLRLRTKAIRIPAHETNSWVFISAAEAEPPNRGIEEREQAVSHHGQAAWADLQSRLHILLLPGERESLWQERARLSHARRGARILHSPIHRDATG